MATKVLATAATARICSSLLNRLIEGGQVCGPESRGPEGAEVLITGMSEDWIDWGQHARQLD